MSPDEAPPTDEDGAALPDGEERFLCPACRTPGVASDMVEISLPYFGRLLEMVVQCSSCGFRSVRFHFLEEKPPARFVIEVEEPEDLNAKVVRSNTGWIRIPQLGFVMEPREAAESFITNVEGVLQRAKAAIGMAGRLVGTDQALRNSIQLQKQVDAVLDGMEPVTLVLEDPKGTSAILHPKAERTKLSDDEVRTMTEGEHGIEP